MNCRHCHAPLGQPFLDLGFAPPSNAYRTAAKLDEPELSYPLRLLVCEACGLVQAPLVARPENLFGADYAYFSSVSSTWLEHARCYVAMIVDRLRLDAHSRVIEVAANDGYLLQYFVERGIPCLGVEPTEGTACTAQAKGVPILMEFFGQELGKRLAMEDQQADLLIGNNVLAHVPDINDFVRGLKAALKPNGTVTVEFPHLLRLLEGNQFDTVYHEHYSYFSLRVVQRIFTTQDLTVIDVEELTTHGGSLRVYAVHAERGEAPAKRVATVLRAEEDYGLDTPVVYHNVQHRANQMKNKLLAFLLERKCQGKKVVGYGAAAKGNTLLNYAGVKPDLLPWVADAASSKQGRYLPGSHIPIVDPEQIIVEQPDEVLILPWNLREEIVQQLAFIREWGGRFVTAVPRLQIWV